MVKQSLKVNGKEYCLMDVKEMAARLKELEKKVSVLDDVNKELERKVGILDDINAVKRLQRAYSYYVQHMMNAEVVDCFADHPDVALNWLEGQWLGKDGVRRYFGVGADRPDPPSNFLHQVMPIAGVVDVEPDGQRAKGRWYSFGPVAMPLEGKQHCTFLGGIYEVEYIKENGVWKFLKIKWTVPFNVDFPEDAWVLPEEIAKNILRSEMIKPDIAPDAADLRFISGHIFPFHYNHPVTGRQTSENARNARLLNAKKASSKTERGE